MGCSTSSFMKRQKSKHRLWRKFPWRSLRSVLLKTLLAVSLLPADIFVYPLTLSHSLGHPLSHMKAFSLPHFPTLQLPRSRIPPATLPDCPPLHPLHNDSIGVLHFFVEDLPWHRSSTVSLTSDARGQYLACILLFDFRSTCTHSGHASGTSASFTRITRTVHGVAALQFKRYAQKILEMHPYACPLCSSCTFFWSVQK